LKKKRESAVKMKDAAIEQINQGDFEKTGKRNSFFSEAEKSLMLFRSIFSLSLKKLRTSKLRTFLTLLGTIVGVAAVIEELDANPAKTRMRATNYPTKENQYEAYCDYVRRSFLC
jgi:hypothetical protein